MALAVVAAINLIITLLVGARDGLLVADTLAARLGYRRGKPPEHAKDLWFEIVGQRLGDGRKRRRALILVLATAAAAQALSLDGYVAGGLIFGLWSLLDIATRAYEKLLHGLAEEEIETTNNMDIWQELAEILAYVLKPSNTNPLQGRWRPLGVATGAFSIGLALVGWIALLSAIGVTFNDVPNMLGKLTGTNIPLLLGVVGAGAILLARAPLELARRYALARPAPVQKYEIVYLRSFQDDRLSIRARGDSRGIVDRLTMRHRHGYEQLLVASMQNFGPVVAIGEPGERLPPTGAFRLYFKDDEWQDEVTRMLCAAKFVVLSLGETPAVGWEIAKLNDLRLLSRTVFLVPPVNGDARKKRLQLLAGHLGIDPALLAQTEPGVEYVGVMFERGHAIPFASAAYDYASYYAAVLEAAFPHFEKSDGVTDIPVPANSPERTSSDFAAPTVAALQLATARREGWPLNTYQILCALVDMDVASLWRKELIRATDLVTDDYQLHLDRPANIAGEWAGVPLTAHAATALRIAADISEKLDLGTVPPEALALAVITDLSSAASRALLQDSELSHVELTNLLQHALEGVRLNGA